MRPGSEGGATGPYQKHPQPRFHRRFGRGLGQLDRATQSGDAFDASVRPVKGPQFREADEASMEGHVERNHSVDKGLATGEVHGSAQR